MSIFMKFCFMLHCKCQLKSQLKSTVKWLIKKSLNGGDLDNFVCCFLIFGFSIEAVPSRKKTFFAMAELSHSVLAGTVR